MKKYIFILLAVLTVALFANAGSEDKYEPAFNHALHVTDNGMECAACHSGATSSMAGNDNLLPKWIACSECHSAEDVANKGIRLGEEKDGFVFDAADNYLKKFSHQKHLQDAKLECNTCHSNLDEPVTDGKWGTRAAHGRLHGMPRRTQRRDGMQHVPHARRETHTKHSRFDVGAASRHRLDDERRAMHDVPQERHRTRLSSMSPRRRDEQTAS
jgi:protein-arginine kinase activator protein McsA